MADARARFLDLPMEDVVADLQRRLGHEPMHAGGRRAVARTWSMASDGDALAVLMAVRRLDHWPQPDELRALLEQQQAQQGLLWPGRPATAADLAAWPETLAVLQRAETWNEAHSRTMFVRLWLDPMQVSLSAGRLVLNPWQVAPAWAEVALATMSGGLGSLPARVTFADIAEAAGCALMVRMMGNVTQLAV